jgi:hypothetical protein
MARSTEAQRYTLADAVEHSNPAELLARFRAGKMDSDMLRTWARLHPEEVPLVNGELPWIAVDLE